jgi:hypothetical protein
MTIADSPALPTEMVSSFGDSARCPECGHDESETARTFLGRLSPLFKQARCTVLDSGEDEDAHGRVPVACQCGNDWHPAALAAQL